MADSSLKIKAKEAKKRMKSGFWNEVISEYSEIKSESDRSNCISFEKKRFIEHKLLEKTEKNNCNEIFYQKVKIILENEGEVGDILKRLSDMEYFSSLSYECQQRYVMQLSERYRECLERYKRELIYKNLR